MNLVKAKKLLGNTMCLAVGYMESCPKDMSKDARINDCKRVVKEHLLEVGLRFNWESPKNDYLVTRIVDIARGVVQHRLKKPVELALIMFEREFNISTLAFEQ